MMEIFRSSDILTQYADIIFYQGNIGFGERFYVWPI